MDTIWLFPGQSSVRADAVEHALSMAPELLGPTLEAAEQVLGRSLRNLAGSNRDIQVGTFVASHLHGLALGAAGVTASASLGLSLGEYAHLVHIGAMDFLEALRLVDARGEAYDAGPPGAMAAVFPLSSDELEPLLVGEARISNLNTPTQQVIAGTRADVDATVERVEEETYAQARIIEAHIAMHHPLFSPVAARLGPVFAAAPWRAPTLPYLSNILGGPVAHPTPEAISELLTRHVCEAVQWQQCVEHVVAAHPGATLVEVGPGTVLHGMLGRGWIDAPRLHTADHAAFAHTVTTLTTGSLHAGR